MLTRIYRFLLQRPALTGLAVLISLLPLLPQSVLLELAYQRQAIEHGQLWRLISAHLVHLSWAHWSLNMTGVLLSLYVAPLWLARRWFIPVFLFLALWVSAGLYFLDPGISGYTGLSGVLYGIVCLSIWTSPYYARSVRLIAVLAIAGKILWEQTSLYDDSGIVGYIGSPVAHQAHLYGLTGFLVAYVLVRFLSSSLRKA